MPISRKTEIHQARLSPRKGSPAGECGGQATRHTPELSTPATRIASGRSALTGVRKEILPREKQILKMIAEDLSSMQIAGRIGLAMRWSKCT
jgi:hypothetical protein